MTLKKQKSFGHTFRLIFKHLYPWTTYKLNIAPIAKVAHYRRVHAYSFQTEKDYNFRLFNAQFQVTEIFIKKQKATENHSIFIYLFFEKEHNARPPHRQLHTAIKAYLISIIHITRYIFFPFCRHTM